MSLDSSVRSLITTLGASGVTTGHEIEVTYASEGRTVVTDQRRFERIVSNLIVNATKHGADPIIVTTTPHAVVVEDHGPGYPPDIIATGPTRFVSAGGGGMGLGLVIAQGQARLLGMRIAFSNGPSGGARTEVFLPEHDPRTDAPG